MLDNLPIELVLAIAELGAPDIAPDRKSLAIIRRRYFVSLAAVSRALYGALRPYIWEHLQIKGAKVDALVGIFTRDPRSAEFIQELVCLDFSQPAFAKLWTLFPRFIKLTSLAISGLLDDTEPLQLCMLERLPALKHLHLRNVLMSKRLPKIARLESLCLDGRVRVHRPLGQDVPIMPDAIISRHSTASKRTLRLVDQDFSLWLEEGVDEQYCLDALRGADIIDLDEASLDSIHTDFPAHHLPAYPNVVFRVAAHNLAARLGYGPLNALAVNLHVWITNPWHTRSCGLPCLKHAFQALCNKINDRSYRGIRLSLPTGLGSTSYQRLLTADLPEVYELLEQLQRCEIPISFYGPRADDLLSGSAHSTPDWIGFEDTEGYFTELLQGRCSDPELRDFKVVMVD